MSTESTAAQTSAADPTRVVTDLELLHRFIGRKLEGGQRHQPLEECLSEFRRYFESVERLRDEIRPGLERSLRGEWVEPNWDELKEAVTRRLAEKGIVD